MIFNPCKTLYFESMVFSLFFLLSPLPSKAENSGQIRVISEPEGASLLIDGKIQGNTPIFIKDISPGSHTLCLLKDGYYDLEWKVYIIPGSLLEYVKQMEPILTTVQFITEPPGATIFIDGKESGKTPIKLRLKSGKVDVRYELQGYATHREDLTIPAGSSIEHRVKMKRGCSVSFESKPEGAKVFIDDKEVGVTPLVLENLEMKRYRIRFQKNDYEIIEMERELKLPSEKVSVFLLPRAVNVNLSTSPEGAEIYIDGKLSGKTPKKIQLKPGKYELLFKLNGYEEYREDLEIIPGKEEKFYASLVPISERSRLDIVSTPSSAIILIDGVRRGKTPLSIQDISPGKHSLCLKLPLHKKIVEEIDIEKGRVKKLNFKLHRSTSVRDWRWATLGIAVASLVTSTMSIYYAYEFGNPWTGWPEEGADISDIKRLNTLQAIGWTSTGITIVTSSISGYLFHYYTKHRKKLDRKM